MRGVSEVVGSVLLVLIAISLAVAFIYWGGGLFSQQSAQAQNKFDRSIRSTYADVDIVNATWYSSNSTLFVSVENTGGVDLTNVQVFGLSQLASFAKLVPDQNANYSSVLASKPLRVYVVSAEGARDDQPL